MEITYYGHSSVGVKLEGAHLLFDPFIRPNGLARAIDVASIRPDYIFLSHCHEDHVADLAEQLLKQRHGRRSREFPLIRSLL